MFAFVVYACGIWYAAARWRRRWQAFAWVAGGLFGLMLVAWLHYELNVWSHGRIFLPILRSMLYPYTALVVVMGLYIACLPQGKNLKGCCYACRYDLKGLPLPTRCPECGVLNEERVRVKALSPQEWFNPIEPDPLSRGASAREAPPEEPRREAPRWPGVAEPSVCCRSEDQ